MNMNLRSIIAAMLFMAYLPISYAEDAKTYLAAHAGVQLGSKWPASLNWGEVSLDEDFKMNQGFHGGLMLGRDYEKSRYELEYQHGKADMQNNGLSEGPSGSARYDLFFINAYRKKEIKPNVNGYLGAGIGWAKLKFFNPCECMSNASGDGLAFQLRAGLEYQHTAGRYVFAQYSHLFLPSTDAETIQYHRHNFGTATIGYRIVF